MTYILLLLMPTLYTNVASSDFSHAQQTPAIVTPGARAVYSCRIFPVADGFGYDIIVNGKTKIHQPVIPGIPGNHPFSSRQDALKISQLVIKKLQAGVALPNISRKELEQQKIKMPKTE